MTWAMIAQLIIQVGWPMAQQIITNIQSNAAVTPQDWAALLAMSQQTAKDRMLLQLKAANIDPASPQGVSLLALAS
jgi:hypothetical protein